MSQATPQQKPAIPFLHKDYRGIQYSKPQSADQKEMLTLAVQSYGHLLPFGDTTFQEFAAKIEQAYTTRAVDGEPAQRNQQVVRFLRQQHNITAGHAQPLENPPAFFGVGRSIADDRLYRYLRSDDMHLALDYLDGLLIHIDPEVDTAFMGDWQRIYDNLTQPTAKTYAGREDLTTWEFGSKVGLAGIRRELVKINWLHEQMAQDVPCASHMENRKPVLDRYSQEVAKLLADQDLPAYKKLCIGHPGGHGIPLMRDAYRGDLGPNDRERIDDVLLAARSALVDDGEGLVGLLDDSQTRHQDNRDAFCPTRVQLNHHYQSVTQVETEITYGHGEGKISLGRYGNGTTINAAGEYQRTTTDGEFVKAARNIFYSGHRQSRIEPATTRTVAEQLDATLGTLEQIEHLAKNHLDDPTCVIEAVSDGRRELEHIACGLKPSRSTGREEPAKAIQPSTPGM